MTTKLPKSLGVETLKELLAGSFQEAMTHAEERIEERFGEDAVLLAMKHDSVVVVHGESVEKYAYVEGRIGERLAPIVLLTPVDEAVMLRESAESAMDKLFSGDRAGFAAAVRDLAPAVREDHLRAGDMLSEEFTELLGEGQSWVKTLGERAARMRETLHGKLRGLKERTLKPKFSSMIKVEDGTAEPLRHEVLPALYALSARLKENAEVLESSKIPTAPTGKPDLDAAHSTVAAFREGVLDNVLGLRDALGKKLRLDARTAPVPSLAKLHDDLVPRLNQIDLATSFVRQSADTFQETP